MPVDLSVVEGDYFRDLLAQPDALRDTLEQLNESKELHAIAARLHKRKFEIRCADRHGFFVPRPESFASAIDGRWVSRHSRGNFGAYLLPAQPA